MGPRSRILGLIWLQGKRGTENFGNMALPGGNQLQGKDTSDFPLTYLLICCQWHVCVSGWNVPGGGFHIHVQCGGA